MARLESRRPIVEALESRRMLAHVAGHQPQGGNPHVGDPIAVVGGVLTILGTAKSDRIAVTSDGVNVTATLNKQTATFLLADFTSISIDGARGNDRITIAPSITASATITGGAGNDRIQGGGGNDIITGDAGNDWVRGGGGDDQLNGGAGNDHVFGESGADVLLAGAGNDEVDGGDGDDNLSGEAGHDRIRGGLGDDLLFGGAGKDLLYGNDGNDFLDGGDDKDKLQGGNGDDILVGGPGNDHLNGGPGSNLLDGGAGTDKLTNGTQVDLSAVLLASLVSPTAGTGSATYLFTTAEGSAEFELQISVTGAALNSPLAVTVNGTPVGTLQTDPSGNGTLVLSTNPLQPDEVLLTGVTIVAGSTITVGDLTGTFALV
jgi:Ca2+-binding RTX toxin-like protein